ncbi:MAG: tRNA (adenosine(37)-N6)-dimethylallyltransferase MiaA [Verrucomicrobiales bacterium]|nr:tRNA (adenosine(37)-N6)-dimethylallyltransferase MiaA [Verrucomicrobiales bacterium]
MDPRHPKPASRAGSELPEILYLAAPTGTGKSAVALWLAERLGGEIVSVDSMQVYRGLDIGTAKPTAAERERIRHHLIDVEDLSGSFDAARFRKLAGQAVEEIQSRGRLPIFCGGTGLYFKTWFEGVSEAPASDPAVREELNRTPLETLLLELQQRDPVAYQRIDRCNPRRVVRALEVIRISGKPFSEQQAAWTDASMARPPVPGFYYLTRGAADLRARIHQRVRAMIQAGWVEETRRALAAGLERNPFAMQAIGYHEIAQHLRGLLSLEQCLERIEIRTRQYAKRQGTWFRKHAAARPIPVEPEATVEQIGRRVLGDE